MAHDGFARYRTSAYSSMAIRFALATGTHQRKLTCLRLALGGRGDGGGYARCSDGDGNSGYPAVRNLGKQTKEEEKWRNKQRPHFVRPLGGYDAIAAVAMIYCRVYGDVSLVDSGTRGKMGCSEKSNYRLISCASAGTAYYRGRIW
jgi:hypothetical protein